MHVADRGIAAPRALAHDEIIRASWARCVHEHRLDPTRMQEAIILPSDRLREHQDRIEDFLHIARHGMEALYQQVAGMGYCVLLTDARGVTVDFIGDLQLDASLRKAGLYLGADWSEQHAGTCGVGTCISTGEALTVHLDDHFDATHIPLTCTTAPVYGAQGQLNAVLDISQLSSAQPKQSQHLALQLVKVYAQHIENANFLHSFRHAWVLRLSSAPQFLDVNPEVLLALDEAGRVIGHNRRAQLLLQPSVNSAGAIAMPGPAHRGDGRPTVALTAAPLDRPAIRAPVQRHVGRPGPLHTAARQRPARHHAGRQRAGVVHARLAAAGARGVCRLCRPARKLARRGTPHPRPAGRAVGRRPGAGPADRTRRQARQLTDERAAHRRDRLGQGALCQGAAPGQRAPRAAFRGRQLRCHPRGANRERTLRPPAWQLLGRRPQSPKRGLIQEADGGTLFLDEIGDMPRDLQARLLRVLAEREVLPIGATRPTPVNIRVIAATHCDLEALVRERRFRDDLYYRLNGAHIVLPPLRERRDLAWLIQRMLASVAGAANVTASVARELPRLSSEVSERLHAHAWPGNLRELRNVIEFACAVCSDGLIGLGDLPDELASRSLRLSMNVDTAALESEALPGTRSIDQGASVAGAQRTWLLEELRAVHGNVSAAARRLGISRMTIYRRMKRAGIDGSQGGK